MLFFKEKSLWGKFPRSVVESLITKLGQDRFDELSILGEKYHFFKEKIINRSSDDFFASFPNYIGECAEYIIEQGQNLKDAEFLLSCSISLNNDISTPHGLLAYIYYITGRDQEAKLEAKKAKSLETDLSPEFLEWHVRSIQRGGDRQVGEALQKRSEALKMMQQILDGTLDKKILRQERLWTALYNNFLISERGVDKIKSYSTESAQKILVSGSNSYYKSTLNAGNIDLMNTASTKIHGIQFLYFKAAIVGYGIHL